MEALEQLEQLLIKKDSFSVSLENNILAVTSEKIKEPVLFVESNSEIVCISGNIKSTEPRKIYGELLIELSKKPISVNELRAGDVFTLNIDAHREFIFVEKKLKRFLAIDAETKLEYSVKARGSVNLIHRGKLPIDRANKENYPYQINETIITKKGSVGICLIYKGTTSDGKIKGLNPLTGSIVEYYSHSIYPLKSIFDGDKD